VDGWPEKEPCIVCGRRQPTYREKSQKKRPGEKPEPPRMLCSSCFQQARQRTSSTFRMRGDDVNQMTKINRPVSGRCQVCNTQVARYSDPEGRIQICETRLAGEGIGPLGYIRGLCLVGCESGSF
jgi:hypothetical protein